MTSRRVLRVAAAQAESVAGDVEANVATAVGLVTEAGGAGARVVVLPELFLTGYDPDGWSAQTCLTGAVEDDPRLKPLREAARTGDVVVVASAAVERAPRASGAEASPRRTISLLVLDGQGGARLVYDKQHLTGDETGFFSAGRAGASIVVDGWELGLGVCYDGCFPEHARAAADAGALAYLCPAAYYTGSEHRRDVYYAARALDNGIYVVFSGLTGSCGKHRFNGGSAIYDPQGRPVQRVADEPRAIVYADLDPAEIDVARELNPMAADRLPVQLLTSRNRWDIGS